MITKFKMLHQGKFWKNFYYVVLMAFLSNRRLSRDARWAYCFMLVHKGNLNAYTMLVRTEDEKNKWIEAIKEAYDNEVPPPSFTSTHEPIMTKQPLTNPPRVSIVTRCWKGCFSKATSASSVTKVCTRSVYRCYQNVGLTVSLHLCHRGQPLC